MVHCSVGAAIDSTPGWIAFDSDRANFNRDIYLIQTNGSGLSRLTTDPGIDKEPAISPDGSRMAFSSNRDGAMQIYLMDLTSRLVTRLTNLPVEADEASFSHDGNRVAFRAGGLISVVRLDGTILQSMIDVRPDDPGATYSWPQFSFDDQELVVDRQNEIDAVHWDGSGFRMIVQNWTTSIRSPSISPLGGELIYSVLCANGLAVDSGTSLWTTPFSTITNPCAGRRVTPVGEPDAQRPAWGPGDVFAYEQVDKATNAATIALIARPPGSRPCILTPDQADSRNPAWLPTR